MTNYRPPMEIKHRIYVLPLPQVFILYWKLYFLHNFTKIFSVYNKFLVKLVSLMQIGVNRSSVLVT